MILVDHVDHHSSMRFICFDVSMSMFPCRRFSLTALCHQLVQSRPQKHSTGVGSVLSMKWDQIRYRMISSQHIEYHWIISESYLNRIELYWIWIHRFHSESHDRWWINSVARRWSTSVPFVRRKLPRSVAWSLAQVYPGLSRGCVALNAEST